MYVGSHGRIANNHFCMIVPRFGSRFKYQASMGDKSILSSCKWNSLQEEISPSQSGATDTILKAYS
jgi:hypothetical protein